MKFRLAILSVLFFTVFAVDTDLSEEELIGWRGDTYKPRAGTNDNSDRRPWVQTISWEPRAQVYHNFLSDAEAIHILKLARYQMKRSQVVGPNDTGVIDSIRTSAGTFLPRRADPVVSAIEQRIATWIHIPVSHQEEMQVLRYGATNKYGDHLDGLERISTVLMYLVAPEEGGETTFTKGTWMNPAMAPPDRTLSACAKGHVTFKPKRGDALLFYDVKPDYLTDDYFSSHTGCPVVKGVKWNAVKWMHGKPHNPEAYERSLRGQSELLPDPGLCMDNEPRCKFWAENGECEKNPGFMMGKPEGNGQCRRSCRDCEPCNEGDQVCLDRNRKAGGYLVVDEAELMLS